MIAGLASDGFIRDSGARIRDEIGLAFDEHCAIGASLDVRDATGLAHELITTHEDES
jgi:hypothetical protein